MELLDNNIESVLFSTDVLEEFVVSILHVVFRFVFCQRIVLHYVVDILVSTT